MRDSFKTLAVRIAGWLVVGMAAMVGGYVVACPFCSVESQTLSEETQSADTVVLARLVREATSAGPATDGLADSDPQTGTARFRIEEVLRGEEFAKAGDEIDVVYFGEADSDQLFMITGIGAEKVDWITPLPLSPAAVEYTRRLSTIPASGADRLAFFQEYLEHDDPLLAQDSYDEFARAPYAELQELRPRMYHDRLVQWIADPEVSPSRRRLYFTMLGVCGGEQDLPLLEELITSDFTSKQPFVEQLIHTGLSLGGPIGLPAWVELVKLDERRKKLGLDALVACYLTLGGGDGLDLIDRQFLKNPHAEYTYIYSTVMALRFHGDEATSVVPRERLLASMRLLLDNPDFADQVPIDLARWKDWSVLDRLVEMYKASDKNGYIRQPVVSYLSVAGDEPGDVGTRAKAALAELERLDPEGVKQALSLAAFGALARARPATSTTPAASTSDTSAGFAASAADVAAAEETDPADIPEPSEFESGSQAEPVATDAEPSADAAAAEAQAAPPNADTPALTPQVDRALIIGLPVVGALLLAGVYWLILRIGAV